MKRNWLPPDSFALSRKRRFRPGSLNLRLNKKRKQERKSNLEWKNPVIFVLLALLSGLVASDITATLDSADGSSAFLFKDSGSTTVAQVDSDGNAVFKGGLRLDATGTECATSEMLIVDGSLGIGTTLPTMELHVEGDAFIRSGSGAELNLHNTSSGKRWQVVSGTNSGFEIGNATDGLIDNSCLFYINSTGSTGIGTASPQESLEVSGAIRIGNATNANNGTLRWTGTDFEGRKGGAWTSLTQSGGDFANGGELGGANRSLGNTDAYDLSFLTSNTTRMFISDTGSVGIGLTDPSYALDVNGTIEALGFKGPGLIKQIKTVEPTPDTSTNSTTFTDMNGMSITMTTGDSYLLCLWSFSAWLNNSRVIYSECLVDAGRAGVTHSAHSDTNFQENVHGHAVKSVSAGSHTIKIRWKVSAETATCNSTSDSDRYSRTLTVIEISK